MTQKSNSEMLHPLIIRYLHHLGWKQLNEIQEQSIPLILENKSDVIISAATASGKTEAAFLPVCTSILNNNPSGIAAIYISPLKALINDQFKRIEAMGDFVGIKVTPWHGDINTHVKAKTIQEPSGILLITPESLESLLINYSTWYRKYLKDLRYIIIDEFHAFIGVERGYQLLSQMHRLEMVLKKRITRIALSATLNNIESAGRWLRSAPNSRPHIVESGTGNKKLLLQLRGYDRMTDGSDRGSSGRPFRYDAVAADLFKLLRGTTNLIFANSRGKTEYLATIMDRISTDNNLPVEFFPHHSSLSKDLRERLENRLKSANLPTTAICTQTLELGIDIGDVISIAQVDAPSSVAGLRQRIGRSGRRDRAAILRLFISELSPYSDTSHPLETRLRDETFLSTALLELMLNNWYEPPATHEYAMSTLIQQILSVISETGSIKALSLWKLLCQTGPFSLITPKIFAMILKSLGENDLITQMRDGDLILGLTGEKVVSKFSFYSSFKVQEEYTIDFNGANIGTVPLNQPLSLGDSFLFAGKGWQVIFFNSEKRQISVKPYKDRANPIVMDGRPSRIHDGIREKMYELYCGNGIPAYLNKTAARHFLEGRELFRELGLKDNKYIMGMDGLYIFPWRGDKIMNTIVQILKHYRIQAKKISSYILLPGLSTVTYKQVVKTILEAPRLSEEELAAKISNLEYDKYDKYLSKDLKCLQYGYRNFDIDGAMSFFETALTAKTPFNPANNAAYNISSDTSQSFEHLTTA